ncbi:class I SAM-dependent methyltransferase [Gallaecimonas sp. GXIMD4217]|uniref:class I SAM-dependent rRNA methyltransferase n=1 Tax=Gallaecimonas sp. GXIMD4217 TaxID=3131927 RepID=UPI00311AD641
MPRNALVLAEGREKSLKRHHPWIFSKAVHHLKGKPKAGDTVEIYGKDGTWLARGAYSPESQIRARVWTFDKDEQIDAAFFERRIRAANQSRQALVQRQGLTGYRVVAAESDGLPGITIDRYADVLVCQLLSTGAERWRDAIVQALQAQFPGCTIYERSDVEVRRKEGLEPVMGPLQGEAPSEPVVIEENGIRLLVDVPGGHKTGYYLDQRDNRAAVMPHVKDKAVLNCFSYTGGFGVYALKGGAARVTQVDVSGPALALARQNLELNGLDLARAEFVQEDVFALLRRYQEEGRRFDVVVLDPPKFVDSKANLKSGCRGYKDINLQAMKLVRPGGTLLTFSCSGLMDMNLFQKIVADAALDAGRNARITQWLTQAPDHPVHTAYPEGLYLKGLVLQID